MWKYIKSQTVEKLYYILFMTYHQNLCELYIKTYMGMSVNDFGMYEKPDREIQNFYNIALTFNSSFRPPGERLSST